MKPCLCTSCGEPLTKPVFFKGKPYGWSCIKKVNPLVKKNNLNTWIIADSSNFNPNGERKQLVTAYSDNKKYKAMVFRNDEDNNWSGTGHFMICYHSGIVLIEINNK